MDGAGKSSLDCPRWPRGVGEPAFAFKSIRRDTSAVLKQTFAPQTGRRDSRRGYGLAGFRADRLPRSGNRDHRKFGRGDFTAKVPAASRVTMIFLLLSGNCPFEYCCTENTTAVLCELFRKREIALSIGFQFYLI